MPLFSGRNPTAQELLTSFRDPACPGPSGLSTYLCKWGPCRSRATGFLGALLGGVTGWSLAEFAALGEGEKGRALLWQGSR